MSDQEDNKEEVKQSPDEEFLINSLLEKETEIIEEVSKLKKIKADQLAEIKELKDQLKHMKTANEKDKKDLAIIRGENNIMRMEITNCIPSSPDIIRKT